MKMALVFGCPLHFVVAGTYNGELRPNKTAPCAPCPQGRSTFQPGAVGTEDCSVCAPGYGGLGCSLPCGGGSGVNATFGAVGREVGSECQACPQITTGFSFFDSSGNNNFVPAVISRAAAESSAECLAEFAQIVDGSWYMGGSVTMTTVANVTSFESCVEICRTDANCQYLTFDYGVQPDNPQCFIKTTSVAATR